MNKQYSVIGVCKSDSQTSLANDFLENEMFRKSDVNFYSDSFENGDSTFEELRSLGLPSQKISQYQRNLKNGDQLISVLADDDSWKHRAESLLRRAGISRVSSY